MTGQAMSVPYEIKALELEGRPPVPASERIPIIARPWVSDRAKKVLDVVRNLPALLTRL